MASGKSTVGPIVANVLGYDFFDLDEMIEAHAGKAIPVIFEEEGEGGFREREAWQLRETADQEQIVVALGGGALTSEANLRFALRQGAVVYLHVPSDQLLERLWHSPTERPLLRDVQGQPLSRSDLRAKIEHMLAEREPYYRQAPIIVEVGDQRVGLTVDAVVDALRRHEG